MDDFNLATEELVALLESVETRIQTAMIHFESINQGVYYLIDFDSTDEGAWCCTAINAMVKEGRDLLEECETEIRNARHRGRSAAGPAKAG